MNRRAGEGTSYAIYLLNLGYNLHAELFNRRALNYDYDVIRSSYLVDGYRVGEHLALFCDRGGEANFGLNQNKCSDVHGFSQALSDRSVAATQLTRFYDDLIDEANRGWMYSARTYKNVFLSDVNMARMLACSDVIG